MATAAIADRLIELLGDAFDALGGGIESADHRIGRGLGAIARNETSVLQGGDLVLEAAHFLRGFDQFVLEHQRCHHREPGVADFAELAAQIDDALIDVLRERLEMIFLAILASETELAAGNGWR